MSKIALHPALGIHEAKRIANEQGCLLVFSGGRLKLKQRRLRRGVDAFETRSARDKMARRAIVGHPYTIG